MAQLVASRNRYARNRVRKTRHWYEERKAAYVGLLAVFDRVFYRLRAGYDAGTKEPDALSYLGEVGPALMEVRLLASGSVRSAALAVHVLLEQLHGSTRPSSVPGVEPEKHFRELMIQIPLVMQQLEAAIREELGIDAGPPPPAVEPPSRGLRSYGRRGAASAPQAGESRVTG